MDSKRAALLLHEQQEKGLSYRTLAKRYKMSVSSVHQMVKKAKQEKQAIERSSEQLSEKADELPNDIGALKEALRKERLKNELLNAVIDISSEELGVDLRKKHDTRPS